MGTYQFRWAQPAKEVFVKGDFDNWTQSFKLNLENGVFTRQVDLPSAEKDVHYKFVVDGQWQLDPGVTTDEDAQGNTNSILKAKDIVPHPAGGRSHAGQHPTPNPTGNFISGIGPGASTVEAAGKQPLEKNMPGMFPSETPETEATSPGLYPGDMVPEYNQYAQRGETKTHEKGASEQTFGVAPLPATAGLGNPIQTKPGDPLPPTGSYTSNTVNSTATTDKASYERSDAYPGGNIGQQGAEGSAFSVPPRSNNLIPESSLPMGPGAGSTERDTGPFIQSAGAGTSTAALAGGVAMEPRGVPTIVKESHQEAGSSATGGASEGAVGNKQDVQEEIKDAVPEQSATSQSSTLAAAAAAGGAVVAGGAAAITSFFTKAKADVKEGQDPITGAGGPSHADNVPDTVKDSAKAAGSHPGAAQDASAVNSKSTVEKELTAKASGAGAQGFIQTGPSRVEPNVTHTVHSDSPFGKDATEAPALPTHARVDSQQGYIRPGVSEGINVSKTTHSTSAFAGDQTTSPDHDPSAVKTGASSSAAGGGEAFKGDSVSPAGASSSAAGAADAAKTHPAGDAAGKDKAAPRAGGLGGMLPGSAKPSGKDREPSRDLSPHSSPGKGSPAKTGESSAASTPTKEKREKRRSRIITKIKEILH